MTVLAALVAALVVLLALAQVLLPRIAASTISSRVGRYGSVESVSVSAWPAVELLWGDADSVAVRAGNLTLSPGQAGKLLSESRGVGSVDVHADSVRVGTLQVEDATLTKREGHLRAEGAVTGADVTAALPPGFGVKLLRSAGGEVEVEASGGLFGVDASVPAVALASEGRLVAHPVGLLIEALQLTLFADPHVYVEGVGASAEGATGGYRLSMDGRLR